MEILLTRSEFREGVMRRDNNRCVICHEPAVDAHHILERRLWTAPGELGGYFLSNGAALCTYHHIEAEQTTLTCAEIREAAGIIKFHLPEHLYDDLEYDKWGNILQSNGTRLKGDLFFDVSVQKILAQGNVLDQFVKYVKYPRTYHVPWSHVIKDDKKLPNVDQFVGKEVVVTWKMDGENVTMYNDFIHARSLSGATGEDRGRVKALHAQIAHDIPDGWRLCGENLYAKHSIHYHNLPSYFMLFSVWDEWNEALSWDETVEWAQMFDIKTVPVAYRGVWDEALVRSLYQPKINGDECEGYVVRLARKFGYGEFRHVTGKYVRPGHVTKENHWRHAMVIPNELRQ
jgi:hypothetical protein